MYMAETVFLSVNLQVKEGKAILITGCGGP
jgi:hypothetical protein